MKMPSDSMKCPQIQGNKKNELTYRDTFIYTHHFYPVSVSKYGFLETLRDTWRHFRDTCLDDIHLMDSSAQVSLKKQVFLIWRHFIRDTWYLNVLYRLIEIHLKVSRSVSKLIHSSSKDVSQMSLSAATLPALAERTVR